MIFRLLPLLIAMAASPSSWAIPINTHVALPVSRGHTVFRFQDRMMDTDRSAATHTAVFAFAYGLTGKTALIGSLPSTLKGPVEGLGDATLFLRHTVHRHDAPLLTSRLGVLGGMKLPTGKDGVGSESTDWKGGVVYTLQHDRHEIDASILYSMNTEAEGIERGDMVQQDLAYQFRIVPWSLPEKGVPSQFNLVMELNGVYSQKDELGGVADGSSGGYKLFASPGLQWVGRRLIAEAGYQIPVLQDLNGDQDKENYRAALGVRYQF